MTITTASACGKMILSGEYAGIFGHRCIAMPSQARISASWQQADAALTIVLEGTLIEDPRVETYARRIVEEMMRVSESEEPRGRLTVSSDLPMGKGMGSSTALVVAIVRCLLGENAAVARLVEDRVNEGHSGLDFSVIWEGQPIVYRKGDPLLPYSVPEHALDGMQLMDTGRPNESTPELIAWIKERKDALVEPLAEIGRCTERLLSGEALRNVMRDHHRAQVALGVVPKDVRELIAGIEAKGGSAKVLGAGGRTGGGGMVLALL